MLCLSDHPAPIHSAVQVQCRHVARCAVRGLYAEVALEPKPGLVSLRDNGSHTDMTAATFVRSLFALRHYFKQMADHGAQAQAPAFTTLEALGVAAEARMVRATGGVNTHRGAIFSLGLLCAAAGTLVVQAQVFAAGPLRQALLHQWGLALRQRAYTARQRPAASNGQKAARRFHLRSAGDEAADGFPTLFEVTWPAMQTALACGQPLRAAKVHALFATMAVLDDTNLAHRGGLHAMHWAKQQAAQFIAEGSVWQPDWLPRARALHRAFVAQRMSPGGAADLIACACWMQEMHALHAATGLQEDLWPTP